MSAFRPLVLVADDDEDILQLVVLRLSRSGYDVISASNGQTAVELALVRRPDVAVIDVSMPVLDGLGVTQALRANPETASTAIILLTARAQASDVERGLAAGADDYVTKPFSPELLAQRVASLLEIAEETTRQVPLLRAVAPR
ncbi:MAG: response regulator transcription factor [Solirubrobacteraceae bacterium]